MGADRAPLSAACRKCSRYSTTPSGTGGTGVVVVNLVRFLAIMVSIPEVGGSWCNAASFIAGPCYAHGPEQTPTPLVMMLFAMQRPDHPAVDRFLLSCRRHRGYPGQTTDCEGNPTQGLLLIRTQRNKHARKRTMYAES